MEDKSLTEIKIGINKTFKTLKSLRLIDNEMKKTSN